VDRIRSWLDSQAGPVIGAANTLFSLLTGLAISAYASFLPTGPSLAVAAGALLLTSSALSYFDRRRVAWRSLPPPFVDAFNRSYHLHAPLTRLESLESRVEGVSMLLSSFVELARHYDESRKRYAASLMVFVPISETAGAEDRETARLWARNGLIKFLPRAPPDPLRDLKGILVLPREFAVVEHGELDTTTAEFALPVPMTLGRAKKDGGDGYNALPGAPMAFLSALERLPSEKHPSHVVEHIARASRVAEYCRRRCFGVRREVVEQVRDYFAAQAETIEGFFSVPLLRPPLAPSSPQTAAPPEPIAVLNIHWGRGRSAGSLQTIAGAQAFLLATAPLQSVLAHLLWALIETRRPHPSTSAGLPSPKPVLHAGPAAELVEAASEKLPPPPPPPSAP
jgi:hypothetical protein